MKLNNHINFYILFGLVFVFSSTACSNHNSINRDINTIRFENTPVEVMKLSEICPSISYIRLETTSKSYINKISKIKFFGDSIFIINQLYWNLKEILVFNMKGKFLGAFGNIGPGPEEIESPRDIVKMKDSYLVWDRLKIAEFDKNGNFKRKILNAFVPGSNFFIQSNKINLYHGTEFPGLISQYDFDGKHQKIFKPIDQNFNSSAFEGEGFINIDNEYHLFAPALDTVWEFSESKIQSKYVFNFMGKPTLQTLFKKYSHASPPEMGPILSKNSPSYVISFNENKNFILIRYFKSGTELYKVISKNSLRQIDFKYCINDIDDGIFGNPVASFDDNFVFELQATKILKHQDESRHLKDSTFFKIEKSIKENDNPVLMFCKFNF